MVLHCPQSPTAACAAACPAFCDCMLLRGCMVVCDDSAAGALLLPRGTAAAPNPKPPAPPLRTWMFVAAFTQCFFAFSEKYLLHSTDRRLWPKSGKSPCWNASSRRGRRDSRGMCNGVCNLMTPASPARSRILASAAWSALSTKELLHPIRNCCW